MQISRREFECILDRKLAPIYRALGLIQQEVTDMSATGEALTAEIAKLDTDQQAENAIIVQVGESVVAAGTEFEALKTQIEGLQSSGALSDEQAQALLSQAEAVDGQITAASTQLTEHVTKLGEETAAA